MDAEAMVRMVRRFGEDGDLLIGLSDDSTVSGRFGTANGDDILLVKLSGGGEPVRVRGEDIRWATVLCPDERPLERVLSGS